MPPRFQWIRALGNCEKKNPEQSDQTTLILPLHSILPQSNSNTWKYWRSTNHESAKYDKTWRIWRWSQNNCNPKKCKNTISPNIIFQGEHGRFLQTWASIWICWTSKKSSPISPGLVRCERKFQPFLLNAYSFILTVKRFEQSFQKMLLKNHSCIAIKLHNNKKYK
jgi:hypothetical protein